MAGITVVADKVTKEVLSIVNTDYTFEEAVSEAYDVFDYADVNTAITGMASAGLNWDNFKVIFAPTAILT